MGVKEIDNRGLPCPQPVLHTKGALEQMESSHEDGCLVSIVDNEGAKENILRLIEKVGGWSADVEKKEDGLYIFIRKVKHIQMQAEQGVPEKAMDGLGKDGEGPILLITTDSLGRGSEELGKILMRSFIITIKESPVLPIKIMFLNSGVYLTLKESPVMEELEQLQGLGVEILSCGTCLDYYKVKDDLAVGKITNMYDTVEGLLKNGGCVTV